MYERHVDRLEVSVKEAIDYVAGIPADHKSHELLDCEDNLRAAKLAIEQHRARPR